MSKEVSKSPFPNYEPLIGSSLDYEKYCKRTKLSLAIAVTLLVVEIILFKTIGATQGIIIGFGCAIGIISIIGLLCDYYALKIEKAKAVRLSIVEKNPVQYALDIIKSQNADIIRVNQKLYGHILDIKDNELLIQLLLAIIPLAKTNNFERDTLKGELPGRLFDAFQSFRTHESWNIIIKDSRFQTHLKYLQEINLHYENGKSSESPSPVDAATRVKCFFEANVIPDIKELTLIELKKMILSLSEMPRPDDKLDSQLISNKVKTLGNALKKHPDWSKLKSDSDLKKHLPLISELENS